MSWTLHPDDLEPIARGCTMLGSGGGGDPYCALIMLKALIADGKQVSIIQPEDLDPDGIILPTGFVGAPLVLAEKLFDGQEMVAAIDVMRERMGQPIHALIAAEIAGMNGMVPLIAAALTGLPVVDGDGMGRAFPRSDQVSFAFNGLSSTPTVMASEQGDVVVIERATNARAEDLARAISTLMGSKAFAIDYPLTPADVRAYAIPGTMSLARSIGRAIGDAKGPDARLAALTDALRTERDIAVEQIFAGRILGCDRTTSGGFDIGSLEIARVGAPEDILKIDFQNEFLTAFRNGRLLASTPDIIALADAESLLPITSDAVRYGQNVRVLAIEAPAQIRTEAALHAVGPRAFGYDFDYRAIGSGPA